MFVRGVLVAGVAGGDLVTTWPFVHASLLLVAFGVGVISGVLLSGWLLAQWPDVAAPRRERR